MDRSIVYPGAIPLDSDILTPQRDAMTALGWLLQATMGTASGVVGLPCTPTSPASMVVNVGAGAIWMLEEIDASAYGSLAADTSPLMKLGILPEAAGTNFTLTAPGTSGDSVNYLIEATFSEVDGTPVVLPYVNPANPSQPYSGPANSGTAQNTVRAQTVELQLKAGAAAPTGTQVTPATDTGYVPLYVITVAYGQTTVIAGDIAVATGAPFTSYFMPNNSAQIAEVVEAAGLTPSISDNGQLLAAIQGWAGKNIQVFTASGTFTVPTGVTKVRVICTGGGGGGAGSNYAYNSAFAGGGCGGAGGTAIGVYAVTPGGSYVITVGTGGSAGTGASPPTSGTAGGSSSFSSFCSATGGGGGVIASGAGAGGAGGTGTGGFYNINGGYGGDGQGAVGTGQMIFASMGGASSQGGGGRSGSAAGLPGQAPGSGGGGSYGDSGAGGAGANGIVVVEW